MFCQPSVAVVVFAANPVPLTQAEIWVSLSSGTKLPFQAVCITMGRSIGFEACGMKDRGRFCE